MTKNAKRGGISKSLVLKKYELPRKLETMDEQIRTGGEDSYALQAECSKTKYGKQIAAELVKRYNCHQDLLEALECAYKFLDSLPEGWMRRTTGDAWALNHFYCKQPKDLIARCKKDAA